MPENASPPAESTPLPPLPGPQADRAAVLDWIRLKVERFGKKPGVYLMKDAHDRVLYVGKAASLRDRVMSYFQPGADLLADRGPRIAKMIAEEVSDVDFLECESEVDALLTENRLIKDIQPAYNERLRDDKSFPYLMIITGEDFPRVALTREPKEGRGYRLFGPFVHPAGLRVAMNALQKAYKFRTCSLDIFEADEKRRFFRPCLLYAIHQCTAPCAAYIEKDAYRQDIEDLIAFLTSKRRDVIRTYTEEMKKASGEQHYEEAAKLRDRIKAIQSLSMAGDPDEDWQPEVFYQDPAKGLEKLGEVLAMPVAPRCIEGLDIAHLHGEETVGALVCFVDGKPFKGNYKRFRIKTVQGVDDLACLSEVVARRYRHAAVNEELYPDLILIDGGLGQLHAVVNTFEKMRSALAAENVDMARPPKVIALAKENEEIYTTAGHEPIRLPRNHPALRLLQQVRDEAHRFAQHYHHLLRAKRTFDEDIKAGRRPPRKKKTKPQMDTNQRG